MVCWIIVLTIWLVFRLSPTVSVQISDKPDDARRYPVVGSRTNNTEGNSLCRAQQANTWHGCYEAGLIGNLDSWRCNYHSENSVDEETTNKFAGWLGKCEWVKLFYLFSLFGFGLSLRTWRYPGKPKLCSLQMKKTENTTIKTKQTSFSSSLLCVWVRWSNSRIAFDSSQIEEICDV